jgi:hypothetical protein
MEITFLTDWKIDSILESSYYSIYAGYRFLWEIGEKYTMKTTKLSGRREYCTSIRVPTDWEGIQVLLQLQDEKIGDNIKVKL